LLLFTAEHANTMKSKESKMQTGLRCLKTRRMPMHTNGVRQG
jgi:hypothetical protein